MEESEFKDTGSFECCKDVKPPEEVLRCFLAEYEMSLSGPNCLSEVKSEKGWLHSGNITRHEPSTFSNADCSVDVKSEDEDMRSFASEYERTRSGSNCSQDAQDVKPEQSLLPSENVKLSDCGPSNNFSTGNSTASGDPVGMRFTYPHSDAFKLTPNQSIVFAAEDQFAAPMMQLIEVSKGNGQIIPQASDMSGPTTKRPWKPVGILFVPAVLTAYPSRISKKSLPTGAIHLNGLSTNPMFCQLKETPKPTQKETPKPFSDPNKLGELEDVALVRDQVDLKQFKCDRCPKAFRLKTALKAHMYFHSSEKRFTCEICGNSYRYRAGYLYHRLTHTDERNFCCEVCGKTFRTLGEVKRHMDAHQQDRPIKCDVCGKGFKRRAHLVTHMLSHSGEKQFLCDRCGKGFSLKYNMLTHRKLHDRKVS